MLLVTPKELKSIRKTSGLTQKELAHLANTSQVHISRIETGAQAPTLDMMIRITRALQIQPETTYTYIELPSGETKEVEVYETFELKTKNDKVVKLLKTKEGYLIVNTGRKCNGEYKRNGKCMG